MKSVAINKEILRLAIPSILANITIPLVGLVDTAVVGHIGNAVAIGGIAIGSMLFDLLYWNFGFLRVGTSGLTAQAFGRSDEQTQVRLLHQSVLTALFAALIIWLLQYLFVEIVMLFIPCSAEVAQIAKHYFYIRIWAAPATLALMALRGWLIGMQNTFATMLIDLTVNLVNIVASIGFAFYTKAGVQGVAWGTLVAQYSGLMVAIAILALKYRFVWKRLSASDLKQDSRLLFRLNGNLFIRSLCFMVVYIGFTSISSSYGDTELAIASIIMKLFMLFSFFTDGFAYAAEAMTGRFIGLNDFSTLKKTILWLIVWTVLISLIWSFLHVFWAKDMILLLTSDIDLAVSSMQYQFWIISMPLLGGLAFLWDGVFIGATDGISVRNAMIEAAIAFVVAYVALFKLWGINALYLAYAMHLFVRSVSLTIRYFNNNFQKASV